MPNYCSNVLTIKGGARELTLFRLAVWKDIDNQLDFNSTVPMPDELINTNSPNNEKLFIKSILKAKYGEDNWYDWQIANWGCKWGTMGSIADPEEKALANNRNALIYHYDTPWAPPTAWLIKTSKRFPALTFANNYRVRLRFYWFA